MLCRFDHLVNMLDGAFASDSAGQGARAQASAQIFAGRGCHFVAHTLEGLLNIVCPCPSYSCKVWASQCHGKLVTDAKSLQRVQRVVDGLRTVLQLQSLLR